MEPSSITQDSRLPGFQNQFRILLCCIRTLPTVEVVRGNLTPVLSRKSQITPSTPQKPFKRLQLKIFFHPVFPHFSVCLVFSFPFPPTVLPKTAPTDFEQIYVTDPFCNLNVLIQSPCIHVYTIYVPGKLFQQSVLENDQCRRLASLLSLQEKKNIKQTSDQLEELRNNLLYSHDCRLTSTYFNLNMSLAWPSFSSPPFKLRVRLFSLDWFEFKRL